MRYALVCLLALLAACATAPEWIAADEDEIAACKATPPCTVFTQQEMLDFASAWFARGAMSERQKRQKGTPL